MRAFPRILSSPAVLAALLLAGCSPRFVITQDLETSLDPSGRFRIGAIADLLPADVADQDRPTREDIGKFRDYLREEIENRDYVDLVFAGEGACRYEIQARLLEYTKGSGFVRYMVGLGAGKARVLTELELVDLADGAILFSGNFEGQVKSGLAGGDQMFRNVARDFAFELQKQLGHDPAAASEVGE